MERRGRACRRDEGLHARHGLASPPRGLTALTFEASRDELVLFTWESSSSAVDGDVLLKAEPGLSAAEREVLQQLAGGASNRVIAYRRGVAERTVANQVASLLRKLRARSRFELIRRFGEAGCLDEDRWRGASGQGAG